MSDSDRKDFDNELAFFIASYVSELNELRDSIIPADSEHVSNQRWRHDSEIVNYLFDVCTFHESSSMLTMSAAEIESTHSCFAANAKREKEI